LIFVVDLSYLVSAATCKKKPPACADGRIVLTRQFWLSGYLAISERETGFAASLTGRSMRLRQLAPVLLFLGQQFKSPAQVELFRNICKITMFVGCTSH
jgi:hypothetical protein